METEERDHCPVDIAKALPLTVKPLALFDCRMEKKQKAGKRKKEEED